MAVSFKTRSPFRPARSSSAEQKSEPNAILFKARLNSSHGPRRLFVPQKPMLSPVFQPEPGRRRGILRVVSSVS